MPSSRPHPAHALSPPFGTRALIPPSFRPRPDPALRHARPDAFRPSITTAKDPELLPTFPEIRNERAEETRRRRAAVEEAGRKRAGPEDDAMFARFDAPTGAFNLEQAIRARRRRAEAQ